MILSIGMVSAEHTADVSLTPDITNCDTLGQFTVHIVNEEIECAESILQVEIYKSLTGISDFNCGPAPTGWSYLAWPSEDRCIYVTSLNSADKIDPGESLDFTFQAQMNLNDCFSNFVIVTVDNAAPEGDRDTINKQVQIDCTAPDVYKTVGEPKVPLGGSYLEGDYWITRSTTLTAHASDNQGQCDLGLDYCEITYTVDGQDPVTEVRPDFDVQTFDWTYPWTFDEDSEHFITITCYDVAGNSKTITETDKVDSTKPKTDFIITGPNKKEGGVQWIDSVTELSLQAEDPEWDEDFDGDCSIGVDTTYYKIIPVDDDYCWGKLQCTPLQSEIPFAVYESPISNIAESCHMIEYYSVDKIGNTEDTKASCFFVDKTPPVMAKMVKTPKVPMYDAAYPTVYNTQFTQDELNNNWMADRTFPTGGVTSVSAFGRDDVAQLSINSLATPSGVFYRTEGIKTDVKNFGDALQVDLYVNSDWQNKAVRSGFWTVGDNGAGARDEYYGIIEFTNQETSTSGDSSTTDYTGWRVWDSENGVWMNLNVPFTYNTWYTLTIVLDPVAKEYVFYINGERVGTSPGGENFIREAFLEVYNYGLDTFPSLSNGDYSADWNNFGPVLNWYVTSQTDIDLSCVDPEPHPSRGEIIHWTTYRSENGQDWTPENSGDYQGQATTIHFTQSSLHNLEWYCEDAVAKKSAVDVEYFKVDNEAPLITKDVQGDQEGICPPANGDEPESLTDPDACFVTDQSVITVDVVDNFEGGNAIHASDNVECTYTIFWHTDRATCEEKYPNGWQESSGLCIVDTKPFMPTTHLELQFMEDSEHELDLSCKDAVGNTATDVEYFLVDITPPVTDYDIGPLGTVYEKEVGAVYVDTATRVTLKATDNKVGVDEIMYRISDPLADTVCMSADACAKWEGTISDDFQTYTAPF